MKGAPTTAEGGVELARIHSENKGGMGWDKLDSCYNTVKITNPALCTGMFDLYLVFETAENGNTSNFGNMYKMFFTSSYDESTPPAYSGTSTISATATVDRYIDDSSKKARLLLAEYDANGTMIELNTSEEKTMPDGVSTPFAISGVSKNASTSYLGAYLWQNDDKIVSPASIGSAGETSGSIDSAKIKADVTNTVVAVTGSGITDDRVMIAIVDKNTYDNTKPLYDNNPVQIWETAVTEGKYDYKFKMSLNLLSGDYYAIVKGNTTNEKYLFNYKSPYDTYVILNGIDNNTTDSDVIGVLSSNEGVFGIESELYANMSAFDMADINTKVQRVFDNTPLVSGQEDYDTWVSAIKDAILPQVVLSYIKNVKNVEKISAYVKKYDTQLGVSSNSKYTAYYEESESATDAEKAEYAKNREYISSALTTVVAPTSVASDFVTIFEEAVIVGMFNKAQSWGYADEALRKFASELTVDISEYSILKNDVKNNMMDRFLNRGFLNKVEIKSLFESIIGEYAIPENREETKYDRIPSDLGEEEIFVEMLHLPKDETEVDNNAFKDIAGVSWATDSINYMSSMGYVNGKGNGLFDPDGNITREEFAAIVVRVFEFGEGDVNNINFTDVDKNAWYAPYVAIAAKKGIVNGVSNNRFGVGEYITREQIAAILKRAAEATYKNILPRTSQIAFVDSDFISDYAYEAVFVLARAGVINGKGKDTFSPKMNATRAEATVMLHRLLQSMI